MLTHLSTKLVEKIKQAVEGTDSGCYAVECTLTNPENGYKFKPTYVSAIVLRQSFIYNYTDQVQITIPIVPVEAKELLSNMQDMECTLKFTPIDTDTKQEDLEQEAMMWEMLVFIDDQIDLDKQSTVSRFSDPDTGEVTTYSQAEALAEINLTLIHKKVHAARQIGLNAILKDVDMKGVLHWVCQQFKFDKVEIVDPDNTQTYEALIIPPMQYIGDIFPFLQERYGIYSKGLGYYFTNDTMYIYPLYDTKIDTSPVKGILQILNVPENEYKGL